VLGVFIGLTGGLFGGLVGLGGGVVMVPMLGGLARLRQQEAHGTSLVTVVPAGMVGAVTYASSGKVDLTGAAMLAVTAVLTAHFGARYAHALPEWKLKRAFGGFLLAVTLVLLAKPWLAGAAAAPRGIAKPCCASNALPWYSCSRAIRCLVSPIFVANSIKVEWRSARHRTVRHRWQ